MNKLLIAVLLVAAFESACVTVKHEEPKEVCSKQPNGTFKCSLETGAIL